MLTFDTRGLAALAVEMPKLGVTAARAMDAVLADGAKDLERKWQANARETSGAHGRHYPDSIDTERLLGLGIAFEIGPNPSKPQGRMSFEEGSVNQPPHLDGQRAADEIIPSIGRRVDSALGLLGL